MKRRPFLNLFYAGTEGIESSTNIRPIFIINTLAILTTILVLSIGGFLFYLTKSYFILTGVLVESSCLIGVVVLNKKKKHFAANISTLLIHCVFALYFGAVLGNAMPVELITAFLLTFLIGSSFLVYKEKKIRVITVITTLLLFLAISANNYFKLVAPIYMLPANESVIRMGCWIGMIILMLSMTLLIIRQNGAYVKENTELLKALEQANAAKSTFLRETSHEIRTPLNAVFGISQLLYSRRNQMDDPATAKGMVQEINYLYAASYLSREIINNVLDLAKIEAGKFDEVKTESINLRNRLEESIVMNRYVAGTRGIKIHLEFDNKLPPFIVTDKIFLTKIINNLTSNAVKFGVQDTTVEIKIVRKEGQILFSIRNTGLISGEKVKIIFDPFESERNSSFEGTGIGLHITKHLVELLGGSITVESNGGYTTFSFNLPLKEGTDDTPEAIPARFAKGELAGYRILIIEDNPLSRYVLNKFVLDLGAEPILAEDGEVGLTLLQSEKPHLVISDSHLPKLQGKEIVAFIRSLKDYKHLPVIIISGDAFNEAKEELLAAGANDFIIKPVSFTDLYASISKFLPVKIVPTI